MAFKMDTSHMSMDERQALPKGARYSHPEEGEPSDNLYIAGLPEAFETESVKQFFGAIGNVTQCKSFGYGFALVRFASLQEAMTVRQSLNGQKPIGCVNPLKITFASPRDKKDDWTCPRCGDLQFQKNTQCRMCGCPRPQAGDLQAAIVANVEGGDWTCVSCGDLQFKKNTSCRLCGSPAPGPGGEQSAAALPVFGKAMGKGKATGGPYGGGKGEGKVKGGPMCTIAEFINELVVGGLPGGDQDPSLNLVYVAGLPPDCTSENLYQIFSTFGPLPPKGARVETLTTGQCDGSGSVNFMELVHADMAVMALNGIGLPNGTKLEVIRR